MINTLLEHVLIKIEAEVEAEAIEVVNNNNELHIKDEKDVNDDEDEANVVEEDGDEGSEDHDEELDSVDLDVKQEVTSSVGDEAELEVLRVESPTLPHKRPRRSTRKPAETPKLATPAVQTASKRKLSANKKKENGKSKETEDEETDLNSSAEQKPAGKKRFVCDQCPRSFNKHCRLVDHRYVHTGEKPFTCDECGKQFRIYIRMNEHKQRHNKKQKFVCEICNLGCCTKKDFNVHMRHHSNDRRFQCTMCPKAFVRSSDLKTHIRVHTGEKPYICDICNKCFRANQNLIVHKKSHMGDASKIFKCEYCDKKFMRNSDRKIHMRSHTGEKPFKCELCERSYSSNVNVKAHMKRDHIEVETRIRKKPGPKPKDWREEVAKQKKLIEELQNQLKQQIKTEEKTIAGKHAENESDDETLDKAVLQKPSSGMQQVSVTVSMKVENVLARPEEENTGTSNLRKMNPPSSAPQDEATTTSTTIENPMSHIPKHDATLFGACSDLTDLNLPTELDILRYYFYLSERAKKEQKKISYKSFTTQVANKLIGIWEQLGMEIMPKNSVLIKLNRLLNKYQAEGKQRYYNTFPEFVKTLNKIFYIGKCKCDLKASVCTCGLVPERLKDFMQDQHNQRRLTVDAFMMKNEEQGEYDFPCHLGDF